MSNILLTDAFIAATPSLGVIGTVLWSIYTAILVFCLSINGYKVYQDLFTPERKSLDHRKPKDNPEITGTYSIILLFTQGSIFMYFVGTFLMLLTYFVPNNSESCEWLEIFAGISAEFGKILLYLIFAARLQWLYGESKHAYSTQKLILVCLLIVMWGLAVIFAMNLRWTAKYFQYSNNLNYCDATLEPLTGSMIGLQDIVCSFGFIYCFWKPLQLTINLVKKDDSNKDDRIVNKILYWGSKTLILTIIAAVSTIILVIATIITRLNFIIGLDSIFHPMCLMLMTPHYNDITWYQKCCFLCIKCCDKSWVAYSDQHLSDAINNDQKDIALLSVATFDQLKITGEQLDATYKSDQLQMSNNDNDDNGN